MKPIILNINEMSDSREVYDSKPNFFITFFFYLILGILLVSIIWMYFGHIDVVVKSEGMIRPNNQVGTVVNTYGGTIVEVNAVDEANVSEGDILYIIEHDDILTELDYYNNQLNVESNMGSDTDSYFVVI
jgi:multidrug efflux pump subunit AcrA (membrane-fusion protein)